VTIVSQRVVYEPIRTTSRDPGEDLPHLDPGGTHAFSSVASRSARKHALAFAVVRIIILTTAKPPRENAVNP